MTTEQFRMFRLELFHARATLPLYAADHRMVHAGLHGLGQQLNKIGRQLTLEEWDKACADMDYTWSVARRFQDMWARHKLYERSEDQAS
jgi:hypothetical protein